MKIAFRGADNLDHDDEQKGWWFFCSRSSVLVVSEKDSLKVPLLERPDEIGIYPPEALYLGSIDGLPYYAAEISDSFALPEGTEVRELRNLFGVFDARFFEAALRAIHFVQWDKAYRFCGSCKGELRAERQIRAKKCVRCGRLEFPRLSPAIIVLIERDGKVLLGRSPRFAGEFYSVLAGFVEPGESLEDAVRREVKEEVGIAVKDISYFGSQPWPFPDSLMIGFVARYESGEIEVDGEEILEADWYSPDRLPRIPGKISIARKLLDWFMEGHSMP